MRSFEHDLACARASTISERWFDARLLASEEIVTLELQLQRATQAIRRAANREQRRAKKMRRNTMDK